MGGLKTSPSPSSVLYSFREYTPWFRCRFYDRTTLDSLFRPLILYNDWLHLMARSTLQLTQDDVFKFTSPKGKSNIYSHQLPEVFHKKSIPKNFAKLTGKHLCLRPATILKTTPWHRCFSVNFKKFSKASFFYKTSLDECFWYMFCPR